jgi:AraC-like DNA-binding protein/quercetin dioxygenase-like cupin family protein
MKNEKDNVELFYKNKHIRDLDSYNIERWNKHHYQNIPKLISNFEAESWPLLLFEYKANQEFTIPFHWHDWHEIVYVKDGVIEIYVENKSFKLTKGQFFFFPSGVLHKTINNVGTQITVLHIQSDYIRKVMPDWDNIHIELSQFEQTDEVDIVGEIGSLILNLEDTYNDDSILAYNGSLALLVYILYKIHKNYGTKLDISTKKTSYKYKERLLEIFNFIDDNLTSGFTLAELAEHMSMSPQYISKIFKKHLNSTFTEYITEKRLELALKYIKFSDSTLTDISFDVGFPNYQSFVRVCREKYGVTPYEYRKQYLLNND